MTLSRPARLVALAGLTTALSLGMARAQAPKAPPPPAADTAAAVAAAMAEAAKAFTKTLTPAQKERALHPFAGRELFKFVPAARTGVPLKMLSAQQRPLVHALLRAGLSQAGYGKATQIMELEPILAELERNPIRRDPENYYLWIFGEPSATGRWAWKFEGHHLSINVTVVDGKTIASVPAFWGANPAEVRSGPLAGRRTLKNEEDLARALVLALPDKLRAQAIFDAQAPPEILTYDKIPAPRLPEVGLPVAAMPAAQKEELRRLLEHFAQSLPGPVASQRLARIQAAGFDKLRFGWAGATAPKQPHYYRIAGPTFVLEYDNTQDGANHVHTVWRDFEGDFGRDLLRDHLESAH